MHKGRYPGMVYGGQYGGEKMTDKTKKEEAA